MTVLKHYGVKGMKWGVITPDGPSAMGSKKTTVKPKSNVTLAKKSPQRVAAEHREAMMRDVEILRSMGRGDMADKLLAQLNGGGISKLADEGEKEIQNGTDSEEAKEEEEEEKKGKGKGKGKAAAAAPKAEKPKKDEAAEKAKEEARKQKEQDAKYKEIAQQQRDAASSFREAANEARNQMTNLSRVTSNLTRRIPELQKDLQAAQSNGDSESVKSIEGIIQRLRTEVEATSKAMEVQQAVATSLGQKADEWTAKSEETMSRIGKKEDESERKAVRHGDSHISHYGIKGMRWGVRRSPEQLGRGVKRLSGRAAQRAASKEAKTLSDSELKTRIARLQLEKQYSDLVKQQTERDRTAMQDGAAIVGKVMLDVGKQSITNVGSKTTQAVMINTINKKTPLNLKDKNQKG